jgi:hypothetical protein
LVADARCSDAVLRRSWRLPPAVLKVVEELAGEVDPPFSSALLASSRHLTSQVAGRLLAHPQRRDVRRALAANVYASADVLSVLASDEDWSVRYEVAGNVNVPRAVLARLASDQDARVRSRVVFEAVCPDVLLVNATFDEDERVAVRAARILSDRHWQDSNGSWLDGLCARTLLDGATSRQASNRLAALCDFESLPVALLLAGVSDRSLAEVAETASSVLTHPV